MLQPPLLSASLPQTPEDAPTPGRTVTPRPRHAQPHSPQVVRLSVRPFVPPAPLTTHGGAERGGLVFLPPPPLPLPAPLSTGLSCAYPAWGCCLSPTRGIDSSCADRHLSRCNVRRAERLTRGLAHGKRQRRPHTSPLLGVSRGCPSARG